jgi:hypothetical protein
MNIFSRLAAVSSTRFGKQILVSLLSLAVSFAACPQKLWASQDAPYTAPAQAQDDQAAMGSMKYATMKGLR